MLILQNLKNYIFLDIETISQYKTFDELYKAKPKMAELWLKKSAKFYNEPQYKDILDIDNKIYFDKASLYPEFSKIIALGVGVFLNDENKKYIKILSNIDETIILKEFNEVLVKINADNKKEIFGHNVISYDIPFMIKRFIYNGFKIPNTLDNVGKKPWEINVYDTLKVTQFGSYEMLSMDLLCEACGVTSPKENMDGSKVNDTFYNEENGLIKIVDYNYKDVNSLMDLAVYFKGLGDI
jgi:3'-5' exonuclease